MTLPLLKLLKSGPPPPKVVLLPDDVFFTRAIPLAPGMSQAAVAAQVELALETLSPFPPAQLYHGFYWPAGAEQTLVFAAYRRRFTAEQLASWDNAELVIPAFAALLGGDAKPGTTLIAPSAEGMTAVYWDAGRVPAKIVFRVVPPDATDTDVARIKDELVRLAPTNRSIELAASPVAESSSTEKEYAFRAEAFRSRLPVGQAAAMDVRDKAALAGLRRARNRDLALWRGFLSLLVLLLLLVVGEFALVGLRLWQKTLTTQADAQRPVVEKIMAAQSVATRINELSTKRLLPFEMILLLNESRPRDVVWFTRTTTRGLYSLIVEATTTSTAALSTYQAALAASPAVEKVEVSNQVTRENLMTFTLAVTFRPNAVKPDALSP